MDKIQLQEKKLYKIRKTCLEMLDDRKYVISDIIKNISYDDFKKMFNNKNIDLKIVANDLEDIQEMERKNIYIHFQIDDTSFGKNDLKKIINDIYTKYETEDVLIILVLKDNPNTAVKKELKNTKYKNIEVFERKNLEFNVSKHILIPKHIKLTKEQGQNVLDTYNCTLEQLPKIFSSDPQIKYHGMRVGDICKIIRNTKENGIDIAYKLVI
jgi:DNA-directed RNA polymerase I, II, and III subunit RPABC1